jgi:hypothetical protein
MLPIAVLAARRAGARAEVLRKSLRFMGIKILISDG